MNCLLVREIPLPLILRMWDTYFGLFYLFIFFSNSFSFLTKPFPSSFTAEEEGISNFHVHVCAAFITQWATELKSLDFQVSLTFFFNKSFFLTFLFLCRALCYYSKRQAAKKQIIGQMKISKPFFLRVTCIKCCIMTHQIILNKGHKTGLFLLPSFFFPLFSPHHLVAKFRGKKKNL